ncbi:hypothetical protein PSHT_02991 [Puccinia striiformis]|uniref:PARP catalytic domain-containing protein n=1 Tax=Puccinia striiformis TaxID=27350 RepID=A0A2S4WGU1_9BASI|nr:hypothetical protein PSHT_02991 [Puccinia striiformis]
MNKQASPNFPPGLNIAQHSSSSIGLNSSSYGLSGRYQDFDPTCTPSRTLWSDVIDETTYEAAAYETPTTVDEFIRFCTPFLNSNYLGQLRILFDQLAESEAGLDYTLRHHNSAILERILEDLQELNDGGSSPIANYHNDITSASAGGYEPPRRIMIKKIENNLATTALIKVSTPACKTPPKHTRGHNNEISRRSSLFRNHPEIQPISNDLQLYNPNQTQLETTQIFHGTRESALQSFDKHGIQPSHCRNEFHFSAAFYASNDIQQAFEHPLHHHIGQGATGRIDTIAVLQFDVAIDILHGNKSPEAQQPPFQVHRFENPSHSVDFADWKEFCDSNMKAKNSEVHDFDIVIGPVCLPSKGNKPVTCLQMKNSKIRTTQIAFCSKRSRVWLGKQIKCIYLEKRDLN